MADDIRLFANELRAMPAAVKRQVSGALTRHTNAIDARARQAAPRRRPWLAVEGIAHDTRLTARRVFTRPDPSKKSAKEPNGADIGFHVEFGTSDTPPQPFLLPAFEAEEQPFIDDLRHILEAVTK